MGHWCEPSHTAQLSLATPPWLGVMSTGDGSTIAMKEMVSSA